MTSKRKTHVFGPFRDTTMGPLASNGKPMTEEEFKLEQASLKYSIFYRELVPLMMVCMFTDVERLSCFDTLTMFTLLF